MIAPPPAAGFRLVRYFIVASLGAFVLLTATLLYMEIQGHYFIEQTQQEQSAFFTQAQNSFAKQHDATARASLLVVHEAGNVNLTRLLANALWKSDFAPFVAKAQRIPVDQCIADVQEAGGKTVPPGETRDCVAEIGKKIMAFPEFRALDTKTRDMMKKSTVFKVKVYDLRGITVYSSERSQIGEDKSGNPGWQSAVAGNPASKLTHRGKFSAFEGVVEQRDLVESYVPVLSPGGEQIVGVFEIYSDVTLFLNQSKRASTQFREISAENDVHMRQATAANQGEVDENATRLVAIILGLLALFYCGLLLIVRNGQRIIDKQNMERKQVQEAMRASAAELRLFADNVPAMTISFDDNLRCLFANKRYEEYFGYGAADILGKHLCEIVGEATYSEIEGHFVQVLQGYPVTYQRTRTLADGEVRYLEEKVLPRIADQGKVLGCFVVTNDVTEHKQTEERIQSAAHHDGLTGLPNRLLFNDRLRQTMAAGKRSGCHSALMFLDLDNFKPLNDTHGHAAGDLLLIEAADRLRNCVRETDTVARFGGDEFVVMISELSVDKSDSYTQTGIIAEKIRTALARPYALEVQREGEMPTAVEYQCTASIGVTLFGRDDVSQKEVLKRADAMMYQAKEAGRNLIRFYDSKIRVTADQEEPVARSSWASEAARGRK